MPSTRLFLASCVALLTPRRLARPLRLFLAAVVFPAMVAACARPGAEAMYPRVEAKAPGATEHVVLIATTRQRTADPGQMFNGERASAIDYAQATISVPPNHVSGMIEFPSSQPGDPNTSFVTTQANYFDSEAAYIAAVNRELEKRPVGHRDIMVFIHGYNTYFPEGVYRLAQLAHDSGSEAVPVHFSWPSRAELAGYVYDQNSATFSRDALEHLLRLLAKTKVDRINILAHSMGNWVLMETFRSIVISGQFPQNKLGRVILAAPDIDIDVFRSQMARIGTPKQPFLIVLSRDDRALAVSRFIAGDQSRLGDYKNAADLTKFNAVVVDLTDVQGQNPLNHDKFAELAKIAPHLHEVLGQGLGPSARETPADIVTRPIDGAPDVIKEVVSLPFAVVSAPIVIIARVTH